MDNFDLRKYLAEGKLLKEDEFNLKLFRLLQLIMITEATCLHIRL